MEKGTANQLCGSFRPDDIADLELYFAKSSKFLVNHYIPVRFHSSFILNQLSIL